jgi:hypothetical protein
MKAAFVKSSSELDEYLQSQTAAGHEAPSRHLGCEPPRADPRVRPSSLTAYGVSVSNEAISDDRRR